jgi:predicted CopG family antitoxin
VGLPARFDKERLRADNGVKYSETPESSANAYILYLITYNWVVEMTTTKTIAVSEVVWERLKEIMKREQAKSFNDVLARLIERRTGMSTSRFGVHKRLKLRFTQAEHEEITRDID